MSAHDILSIAAFVTFCGLLLIMAADILTDRGSVNL